MQRLHINSSTLSFIVSTFNNIHVLIRSNEFIYDFVLFCLNQFIEQCRTNLDEHPI